jgi:hypothetical protein
MGEHLKDKGGYVRGLTTADIYRRGGAGGELGNS